MVCFCGLELQREMCRHPHTITQPWVEALLHFTGETGSRVELVYLIPKPLPLISVSKMGMEQALGHGHARDK